MKLSGKIRTLALVAGFALGLWPLACALTSNSAPYPGSPEARVAIAEYEPGTHHNTESYTRIDENPFLEVSQNPLSTFSIDVDTASYSNMRRFIRDGKRPPKDAVRIEELINYFSYDYPDPQGAEPFSVSAEVAGCPWNDSHRLVHIGLQGRRISKQHLPPRNLVFLLDVSGSMGSPRKLPLLKSGMRLLTEQLNQSDRVSMVVYAGASGLVLAPTPGDQKNKILESLSRLEAGGSTNGGAGIQLAYQVAQKNFDPQGINRVILATDGDFNVGVSSQGALTRMIEEKRKGGVFLTVLGFGSGNLKDSTMEQLADRGNGNYAYIDSLAEARKVLVRESGATLVTIAQDVKIQVEFNPRKVESYRLIGYENRLLQPEDFNDDKKDAGEIGAGHTVTALYEVVPASQQKEKPKVDALKYQTKREFSAESNRDELMTIKLRHKEPGGSKSSLTTGTIQDHGEDYRSASENFRFSASVAAFGMWLRDSEHKGESSLALVTDLARNARGPDPHGYRAEFLELIDLSEKL